MRCVIAFSLFTQVQLISALPRKAQQRTVMNVIEAKLAQARA